MRVNRVPMLDGFRGLAIILILLHHGATLQPDTPAAPWIVRLTAAAWCGVPMFFVLSGFLITGILLETKHDAHFFRTFYMRRALRIFPLYYAFITGWFGLRWATYTSGTDSGGWMYYLYLTNFKNAHDGMFGSPPISLVWSLAIEEQFYFLWPAIVWMASERALAFVCACLMVIAPLFRALMVAHGANWVAVYALTPSHLDSLAIGAAIALLVRYPERLAKSVTAARLAGFTCLSILLVQIYTAVPMFADASRKLPLAMTCFAGLFGSILIVSLGRRKGWLNRAMSFAPLRTTGKYSYAIYLFHITIACLLVDFHISARTLPVMPHLLFDCILFAVTFCAAFVSWHLYEKQFLRLKEFFQYSHPPDVAPAANDHSASAPLIDSPIALTASVGVSGE